MYIYIQPEPLYALWTVGFYAPNGEWVAESDWAIKEYAAQRTAWLNGSSLRKFKGG